MSRSQEVGSWPLDQVTVSNFVTVLDYGGQVPHGLDPDAFRRIWTEVGDRFGRQDEVRVLRIGQGPDPNPEDQKSKISALILERIGYLRG